MFKRIVKIIIIGISIYLYGIYNIYNYSVYYAKHMPYGEDRDLMIMEFVDNLWWQNKPDAEHLEYDMDGTNGIVNQKTKELLANSYYNFETEYIYIYSLDNYYRFNKNFKLSYASYNYTVQDINLINEVEVKNNIYKYIQFVLDNHNEPIINLQWLYNLINQDRINYMTNRISE